MLASIVSSKTSLSPPVRRLVCQVGISTVEPAPPDLRQVIRTNHSLHLAFLDSLFEGLPDLQFKSNLYYEAAVRALSPVFVAIENKFFKITKEKVSDFLSICSYAVDEKTMRVCFQQLTSDEGNSILALILATSSIERVLGDVYLTTNKPVPFLLKDLLVSNDLNQFFGSSMMRTLEVLIGPPTSLNLRNLAMHGFLTSGEFPARYCFFILALIANLGESIKLKFPEKRLPRRNLFVLSTNLSTFPGIGKHEANEISEAVASSLLIPKTFFPQWEFAVREFIQERYANSVLTLLPFLEHIMRHLFAFVNNCPERVLTAQSSEFYTTFDEILSEKVNEDCENQLRAYVGDQLMIVLHDLLVFSNGPRLRDRLSHGEVDLNSITRDVANHVVCVTVVASLITEEVVKDNYALKIKSVQAIFSSVESYKCLFSPHSTVLNQVHDLGTMINTLKKCVVVDEENDGYVTKECEISFLSPNIQIRTQLESLVSLLEKFTGSSSTGFFKNEFTGCLNLNFDTKPSLESLQILRPNVLYRPHKELELVGCLQQIATSCTSTATELKRVLDVRFEQFSKRELRSRQRSTYNRMVKTVPIICVILQVLFIVLVSEGNVLCEDPSCLLVADARLFRLTLRFIQNLEVMVNIKKNRWEESRVMIEDFVKTFIGLLSVVTE